jgi:hypothetical protein
VAPSVWYVGTAQKARVTQQQWQAAGITGTPATVEWNSSNSYSLPRTSFTQPQLDLLSASLSFNVTTADGPRPGPATSSGGIDLVTGAELAEALAGIVAGSVPPNSVDSGKLAPTVRASLAKADAAVPAPAGAGLVQRAADGTTTAVDPATIGGAQLEAPDSDGYSPVMCKDGTVRAIKLYGYDGGGGGGGDGSGFAAFIAEDWNPSTLPAVGTTDPWPNAITGGNPITVQTGHVQAGGRYFTDNGGMRGIFRAPIEIEPTSDTVTAVAAKMKDVRFDNGPDRQWLVSFMAGAGNDGFRLASALVHSDGTWRWGGLRDPGTGSSEVFAAVTQETQAEMDAGLPQPPDNPLPWPGWIGDLTVGMICRPAGGATPSQLYINGAAVLNLDVTGLPMSTAVDLNPLNVFGTSRGNKAVRRVAVFTGGSDAQAVAFLADVQAS